MCFIGHEELAVGLFPRKEEVFCMRDPMGQHSIGLTSVRWLLHVWLRVAHLEASKKENLLELGMAFREMESEILTSSAAVAGLHFHYPSVMLSPE